MKSIKVVTEISEMQELAAQWAFSKQTALVPTMGYLHEGHLSLVREAAYQSANVVVSIFVNPLQFGPNEDFEKYPRDVDRDIALLADAGATTVFMPSAQEITPEDMTFTVDPGPMGSVLCGHYRPGHFVGVCTIVLKLLQLTRPGTAIFGWKDAQQFLILRKMVQDLNVPVSLRAIETMRETSGLAMSSRNTYLTPEELDAAPAIFRGLGRLKAAVDSGEVLSSRLKELFRAEISGEKPLTIQYVEVVRMDTLEPIDSILVGNTLVAVAVYAGSTRLIDNIRL